MTTKKGVLLSVFAGITVLVVGLALVVFLPLPEERAFNELSKIQIGPLKFWGASLKEAVAEMNAQIQKKSPTEYRFHLVESPLVRPEAAVTFEVADSIPLTKCAEHVADCAGLMMHGTRDGVVFDHHQSTIQHYQPSWRRSIREWFGYELPNYWYRRHTGPPTADPFAPMP